MEVEVKSLRELMRLRKVSIKELSEATGISESTIQRHLTDCNWDCIQIDSIVRALSIPRSFITTFFYDPVLELNGIKEEA
jgi:DNA-binding Xre family transcriptional regulator